MNETIYEEIIYNNRLAGLEVPYDTAELHRQREQWQSIIRLSFD